MNKKQYNNVIDWTVKHEQSAQTRDNCFAQTTEWREVK